MTRLLSESANQNSSNWPEVKRSSLCKLSYTRSWRVLLDIVFDIVASIKGECCSSCTKARQNVIL